ncbi:hypothetical protein EXIGLDRAFT_772981, partial [Exidia glandulosa HHB12029]
MAKTKKDKDEDAPSAAVNAPDAGAPSGAAPTTGTAAAKKASASSSAPSNAPARPPGAPSNKKSGNRSSYSQAAASRSAAGPSVPSPSSNSRGVLQTPRTTQLSVFGSGSPLTPAPEGDASPAGTNLTPTNASSSRNSPTPTSRAPPPSSLARPDPVVQFANRMLATADEYIARQLNLGGAAEQKVEDPPSSPPSGQAGGPEEGSQAKDEQSGRRLSSITLSSSSPIRSRQSLAPGADWDLSPVGERRLSFADDLHSPESDSFDEVARSKTRRQSAIHLPAAAHSSSDGSNRTVRATPNTSMEAPAVGSPPRNSPKTSRLSAKLVFTSVAQGPFWLCDDRFFSTKPATASWMTGNNTRQMALDFVQLDLPLDRIKSVDYQGEREYEMDTDVIYSFKVVGDSLSKACEALYAERDHLPRLPHQWKESVDLAVSASYPRTMNVMQVFAWAMSWLDYVRQWLEFQHKMRRYNDLDESPEPDVRTLLKAAAQSTHARSASLGRAPRSRDGSTRGRSTTRVTHSSQRDRSVSSSKSKAAEEIRNMHRSILGLKDDLENLVSAAKRASSPAIAQDTASLPPAAVAAPGAPVAVAAPGAQRRASSAPPSTKPGTEDDLNRDIPPQLRKETLEFSRARQKLSAAEIATPGPVKKGKEKAQTDVFAAAATPYKPPFEDGDGKDDGLVHEDDLGIIQGLLHGIPPALGGTKSPPAPIAVMQPEQWRHTPTHLPRTADDQLPASEFKLRAQPAVGAPLLRQAAYDRLTETLPEFVRRPASVPGDQQRGKRNDNFPDITRIQRDPFEGSDGSDKDEGDARRPLPQGGPPDDGDGSSSSHGSRKPSHGRPDGPPRWGSDGPPPPPPDGGGGGGGDDGGR